MKIEFQLDSGWNRRFTVIHSDGDEHTFQDLEMAILAARRHSPTGTVYEVFWSRWSLHTITRQYLQVIGDAFETRAGERYRVDTTPEERDDVRQ